MSYINANGESRTTVSVRLTGEDLDALDELVDLLRRQRVSDAEARGASKWEIRRVGKPLSRSDGLREAIRLGLQVVGR